MSGSEPEVSEAMAAVTPWKQEQADGTDKIQDKDSAGTGTKQEHSLPYSQFSILTDMLNSLKTHRGPSQTRRRGALDLPWYMER